MNGYERVLSMIAGQTTDSIPLMPITMMFAADRIGAKYRDYASDYRILVEGQLRVAEEFDLDYVSCISDPAREAADCGAAVQSFDEQPPAIDERAPLLADKAALASLKCPDPLGGGRMHDRVKAAAAFREQVGGERLIEGWIEGPCAEAADLRGINTLMMDFYEDPGFVSGLFDFAVELGLRFARAQVDAGVDIIGVGDAAASLIGPELYRAHVWPYEKRLVDGLHAMGTRVRMHICGDIRPILAEMGQLGCEIVDLDWMVPVSEARAAMGPHQVLLGNIDPVAVLRNGTPEMVFEAIAECHRQAGDGYIVGAGCEVPRGTPDENMQALTRYARG
ncbi:MAG: uroporphyrinogen decarboxylase family protein [FCB group bacterium]|jgi:MtaA/CmuA family methyltransferase|nr:uroporphyrinogen decarboxylase family protein [FCB group bacterium]